ncbi:hypothetical protein FRC18_010585 [Serendipita sp. 400]|nr:hypothetical protein FRC18_010585 [Serendipita sp. 400]
MRLWNDSRPGDLPDTKEILLHTQWKPLRGYEGGLPSDKWEPLSQSEGAIPSDPAETTEKPFQNPEELSRITPNTVWNVCCGSLLAPLGCLCEESPGKCTVVPDAIERQITYP